MSNTTANTSHRTLTRRTSYLWVSLDNAGVRKLRSAERWINVLSDESVSLYCDGETALLRLSYSSDHAGVALSEWAAQVGVAFVDTSLWIASRRQEIDDELVPFRYRGQAATLPGIAVGGQDDSSSSIRSIIDTHLLATAAIPQVIATQQTKPGWGQRSDMPAHRQ